MDVDALLQSHGEDAPSGEDLEYDPAFTELEIAATPGEERQVGDEIIAAEDPDYKEMAAKASEILGRSHDLRAGIFMAEAQLSLKGLPGFAEATRYLRGCLEQYWETCHPQLDEDDDDDPTMRVNAVLSLADTNRILRNLRRAPLTDSRVFGVVTLRDIAVAEGEATPSPDIETVLDGAGIAAAFQDTDPERLSELSAAATEARDNVTAISEVFDAQTPGQGPDLDPLLKLLKQITSKMANATGAPDAVDADETDDAPAAGGASARPIVSGGGTGAINTSTDVMNAIDRIMAYYEKHEPSSPVPILLARAKKLVNADFMTIVKDMAPGGVDNVNLIGGFEEEDEY